MCIEWSKQQVEPILLTSEVLFFAGLVIAVAHQVLNKF